MKFDFLLDKIDSLIEESKYISYNNIVEEAIKIALKVRKTNKPIIVCKQNPYLANKIFEILKTYFLEDEIVLYTPEESLRVEEIASSFENKSNRLNALYNIIFNDKLKLIVTTTIGLVKHLPNKKQLLDSVIDLKVNDVISKSDLVKSLIKLGYEKVNSVETPLTFAQRGCVIDVFSINYLDPIRIEFFDDQIDSIRFFNIENFKTISKTNSVKLVFAKDVFFNDAHINHLKNLICEYPLIENVIELIEKDHFENSYYFYYSFFENTHLTDLIDCNLYISNIDESKQHFKFVMQENINYIQEMNEINKLPLRYFIYDDFLKLITNKKIIEGKSFYDIENIIETIDMPVSSFEQHLKVIENDPNTYKLIVIDSNKIDVCKNYFKDYHIFNDKLHVGINLLIDELYGGFTCSKLSLSVYGFFEFYRNVNVSGKYAYKFSNSMVISSNEDLKKGDYVVHDQYGIAIFDSIVTKSVNGIKKDYLKLIYKNNSILEVPLQSLSLIRKFVSSGGYVPKLSKLGSKTWQNTKKKVEENVESIAKSLLELYAQRSLDIGFKFKEDDHEQIKFENDFIYELTNDQKKAIEDVKEDMQSLKPMDRLLCGDVGFGKTEVAAVASFKAIQSNKQVAYLCPTTILSFQHYKTFLSRFKNFAVNIKLVNRFVTSSEIKQIVNDLKSGKIDILIGTHRLLSNDIKFKDLGLLIIDEEQRFGVEHKEKIKVLKKGIDVLSLSATPIPRSLQLSLIGIRGLSTIYNPPSNRYPVQTYVVKKSKGLIYEAIMKELSRNGQVFYLHNNIDSLYLIAKEIKDNIKYASVAIVHGQMKKEDIEDIMLKFYNNEINVLVCTTIIETGLDIANANTILIDNAHTFGLSQLYQIKGRVGRSNKVGYAYLMIPGDISIKQEGQMRLEAIKQFCSLGSGYKIAMKDLAIRGAGDLLGESQSGFINNVGLDLYIDLLQKAIEKLKSNSIEKKTYKPLNIEMQGYLDQDFFELNKDKLDIYQKLNQIKTIHELIEFIEIVEDKFGKLDINVKNLFEKKRLEILYNMDIVEKIINQKNMFQIYLTSSYSDMLDGLKLFKLVNSISKDIEIEYKNLQISFKCQNKNQMIYKLLNVIDKLENVLK